MSENINIVACRIFNRLDDDIEDRIGLKDVWVQISPQIKNDGIRRAWEQIFTEEIEKHTAELQARVKRLEEAGDVLDNHIACGCGVDGPCRSCIKALDGWKQAKEPKP